MVPPLGGCEPVAPVVCPIFQGRDRSGALCFWSVHPSGFLPGALPEPTRRRAYAWESRNVGGLHLTRCCAPSTCRSHEVEGRPDARAHMPRGLMRCTLCGAGQRGLVLRPLGGADLRPARAGDVYSTFGGTE